MRDIAHETTRGVHNADDILQKGLQVAENSFTAMV